MPFTYLDDDTLDEVRQAAIRLGFADDAMTPALTAGINPEFVAFATQGGNPLARLTTLTTRLNGTRVPASGEVPFKKWLRNAITLSGSNPEEMVFRRALEQMSTDGVAEPGRGPGPGPGPASTTSDVRAVPHHDGALRSPSARTTPSTWAFCTMAARPPGPWPSSWCSATSAARRRSSRATARTSFWGPGWLIAPRLLITNHHVVNARTPMEAPASAADLALQAAATNAVFDFFSSSSVQVPVKATGCVASDEKLDYALLRLPDDTAPRAPLRLRVNPILKAQDQALTARVNVLQHPNGEPMRLGFRNNFVVSGDAERLSYLTDTSGGSSGSPICDDAWFAAALHRGFATIGGAPVMVWGREIRQENYGTPITRVLAHLGDAHPELLAEITAAQATLGPLDT